MENRKWDSLSEMVRRTRSTENKLEYLAELKRMGEEKPDPAPTSNVLPFRPPTRKKAQTDTQPEQADQELFLAVLGYGSEESAQALADRLSPAYFESTVYQAFVERVGDYVRRYKKAPGSGHIRAIFVQELKSREAGKAGLYADALSGIAELAEQGINEAFVLDRLGHFEAQQKAKAAAGQLVKELQTPSPDLAKVRQIGQGIAELGPEEKDASGLSWRAYKAEHSEPVAWVIQDVLPAKGLAVVASMPGCGKSTLLRDLAVCVATGQKQWLGHTVSRPGPVCLLTYEDIGEHLVERFTALGLPEDAPLYIYDQEPEGDPVAHLRSLIDRHKPALVIADTLGDLLTGLEDANNYLQVSTALRGLQLLARKTGVCIVLAHHTNKNSEGENLTRPLGSVAVTGKPDVVFMLSGTAESKRYIQTIKPRLGKPIARTEVLLDAITGRCSLGQTVDSTDALKVKALALLPEDGSVVPQRALVRALGVSGETLSKLRQSLESEGEIRAAQQGKHRTAPWVWARNMRPS